MVNPCKSTYEKSTIHRRPRNFERCEITPCITLLFETFARASMWTTMQPAIKVAFIRTFMMTTYQHFHTSRLSFLIRQTHWFISHYKKTFNEMCITVKLILLRIISKRKWFFVLRGKIWKMCDFATKKADWVWFASTNRDQSGKLLCKERIF